MRFSLFLVLLHWVAIADGCSAPPSPAAAERGRRAYLANCITCHNPDPTKDGASGPQIAGVSREVLEAKVLHGTYPAGYTPKRTTHAMVPLPHLASRIDDLVAFLAAGR